MADLVETLGPARVFQQGMPTTPPRNPEPLDALDSYREGDRIIVATGEHAGRRGRVALTHDSDHQIVARLLALQPGLVRVVLDRDETEGSWSGVLPVSSLVPTRFENDDELYVRLVDAHELLGKALDDRTTNALDDVAKKLRMERREVAISETPKPPGGLHKR